jgi:hypothetical protein
MTRTEFEEMDIYDLIEWADENIYEFTDEEMLISFAKNKIDEDNIGMAVHILSAVYESDRAIQGRYFYDYSLGTISTPTPLTCKEDFEDYISFEEEDTEEELEVDLTGCIDDTCDDPDVDEELLDYYHKDGEPR